MNNLVVVTKVAVTDFFELKVKPYNSGCSPMISLRRITTSTWYIPQIDGLRFIAIASVIFFHIYQSIAHGIIGPVPTTSLDLHRLSKRGVELFFTISGFVLALPFARSYRSGTPGIDLKAYFLRRLTRLEPPYVTALFVTGVALIGTHTQSLGKVLPHLLASLCYVHYPIFHSPSTIIPAAWSMEVEIQFYLLVPIFVGIFKLARVARRAVLAAATVLVPVATLPLLGTFFESTLLYYLGFFLAGFLATDNYLELLAKPQANQSTYRWDLLAFAILVMTWMPLERISHVFLPLAFVLLFTACFRGKVTSWILRNPFAATVGGMCYTIYLYHMFLISALTRPLGRLYLGGSFAGYFALQSAILLPIILVVCSGAYWLIERPCMDKSWPQKLAQRLFHHPVKLAQAVGEPSANTGLH